MGVHTPGEIFILCAFAARRQIERIKKIKPSRSPSLWQCEYEDGAAKHGDARATMTSQFLVYTHLQIKRNDQEQFISFCSRTIRTQPGMCVFVCACAPCVCI